MSARTKPTSGETQALYSALLKADTPEKAKTVLSKALESFAKQAVSTTEMLMLKADESGSAYAKLLKRYKTQQRNLKGAMAVARKYKGENNG
jgi:hypothetical protein